MKRPGFVIERLNRDGRWSDDIRLAYGVANEFETETEATGALVSTSKDVPGAYRVTPVWL